MGELIVFATLNYIVPGTKSIVSLYDLYTFSCNAAPLRRRPNFVRHEKEWMRRKRLKMERRYLRMQEGVEELKAYIKFKQDNKPRF